MPPRNSPGPGNIPYKLNQLGGLLLKRSLFSLILREWECKQVPKKKNKQTKKTNKDAIVITIFQKEVRRNYRNVCGNNRGISLLWIVGNIIARIQLNRLQVAAEKTLPEFRCRFGIGTINMVLFCLWKRSRHFSSLCPDRLEQAASDRRVNATLNPGIASE